MKKEVSYQRIQSNLSKFILRWKDYNKNEKIGAQTYLNEFFECFGIVFDPNKLPYEKNTGKGFADCYIKGKLVLEMKDGNKVKTKNDLLDVIPQAERYWNAEGKEANYLVICNFKSFVIFDTRDKSKTFIKVTELEQKANCFAFLMDASPYLLEEQETVSRDATKTLAQLYKSLLNRLGEERIAEIDTFILQCVFCMFAEDVGFLPYGIFTNLVKKVEEGIYNSAHLLTQLFKMMDERDDDRKQGSLFENVRWFNGPLFKTKPEIVLYSNEIELLKEACSFDWSNIKPEIFGVLFESSTDDEEKHKNGMHFTSEEDILKIIKPCITDLWETKFSKCKTQDDFEKLHKELLKYRVLDPACGSGNFLLVAYREIKRIESRIFHRLCTLTGKNYRWVQNRMGHYPVQNMYGIEFKNFPTLIARVSLWIAKKRMQIELQLDEADLPLESLNHIVCADALVQKWDEVDVVIGNPPYIGCKQIRSFRGDEYFNWLSERFSDHNKMSDYCTYWYEKVLEDVRPGIRVGLVNTNTISQNASRIASLDKIVKAGGEIFDVHKDIKWSGDAQVTVSLVCFTNKKHENTVKRLNGLVTEHINSRLEANEDSFEYPAIHSEKNSYVGVAIQGIGFTLTEEQKNKIIKSDPNSKNVIKKFLSGDDLNQGDMGLPSRWIVDFADLPLEQAGKYKLAFKHVQENVKPHRDTVRRAAHKKFWWHFGDKRMELREKIKNLKRMLVTSNVSKHVLFQFVNSSVLPSHSCTIIAKDDFFTFGVLNSIFHDVWSWHTCSTFETRIRYSGTTAFDTFPMPNENKKAIESISEELHNCRLEIMKKDEIGLTDLYNLMKSGGYQKLQVIHSKLDKEIAKGYGFPVKSIEDRNEILNFLKMMNDKEHEKLAVEKLVKFKQDITKEIKKRDSKKPVKKTKKIG